MDCAHRCEPLTDPAAISGSRGSGYFELSSSGVLIENHTAAVALNYFAYNFVRIHRTLRMTSATAAGVTDRLFGVSDLAALLEAEERETHRAA